MNIEQQIAAYISEQRESKQGDMIELHHAILQLMPGCKLWFLDGKDASGKIVSNPNIGYGFRTMKYAGGKTRDFYQIGMSGNTTGISVYILSISDKKYLAHTYGTRLGKARVTGYCIKFKSLKEIDLEVLKEAIRDGVRQTS